MAIASGSRFAGSALTNPHHDTIQPPRETSAAIQALSNNHRTSPRSTAITQDTNAQIVLAVDDGSFEQATGLAAGGTSYRVNRLTSPSYPVTINSVSIFFGAGTGVSVGDSFSVIVGLNPSGSSNINGLAFQSTPATIQGLNQFNTYNVPNMTLNSGDFVVGMIFNNAPGTVPFIIDTTPPSKQRSYRSVDNGATFSEIGAIGTPGNYAIRATVTTGQVVTCPVVSNINPTSGPVGTPVTITGSGFTDVNLVKFSNNVTASFTVVNDTTITTTVPSNAITGPIFISKLNCADVQTQTFTVTTGPQCVPISISTTLTGATGSGLMVPVTTGDLTGKGVTAYDFTLNFDPSILQLQSSPVDNTGTLSSGFTVTANSGTPGKLIVSAFGTSPLSGAGTLLNLKFNLIGQINACSNLTWQSFVFNEGTPCVTTSNGKVCLAGGSISGTVNYGTSPTPKVVPGVLLSAAGAPAASNTTNSSGNYSLLNLGGGPYTVTPAKSGDVNGISALDASLVAQHVAGLIMLTANQQLAGDASGNGGLSGFDASLIAQTAAGIPNTGIAGTWKFVPATRSYPSLSGNLVNQNYDAILVGDVTGNWTPPPGPINPLDPQAETQRAFSTSDGASQAAEPILNAAQTTVSLPAASGVTATSLLVPLTTTSLTGLGVTAYDLTLTFDPTVAKLQGTPVSNTGTLSSGLTITANTATPGKLIVSAFGTTPLSGAGTLLNLQFDLIGAPGASTPLSFTNFNYNEGTPTSMTTNGSITLNSLAPTLTSLSPSSAGAGGGAFTLTATGTNFASSSVLQWNGSNRATTFVNATMLTAAITAADIAAAGTASVTVVNPPPGGGTSNALNFTTTAAALPCRTFCFRSAGYYLLHLDSLPKGVVLIGGGNANSTVSTSQVNLIQLALEAKIGNPANDPLQALNREFVAAQLNLLRAGGSINIAALNSPLSCYGVSFTPATLSNGVVITVNTRLGALFDEARSALVQHRIADMLALAQLLHLLNGDDLTGNCKSK